MEFPLGYYIFLKIIISRRQWEGTHGFSLLPLVFSKEIGGDLQWVQPVLSISRNFLAAAAVLGFRNPWDVCLPACSCVLFVSSKWCAEQQPPDAVASGILSRRENISVSPGYPSEEAALGSTVDAFWLGLQKPCWWIT